MDRSNNLNVLRASAVLIVFTSHVIYYFTPYTLFAANLGRSGVLLFFVHTTNVLMLSLQRSGDTLGRFMLRRAFRIYPLAIVSVVIYAALAIPVISGPHLLAAPAISRGNLFASLSLTQNLFGAESIPTVLWSLPYEMQMYFVLPTIFLLVRNRRPSELITIWIIAAVAAFSAMAAGDFIGDKLRFAPCFLAGALAFALPTNRTWPPVLLAVGIFPGAAIYALTPHKFFFAPWLLCLCIGCLLPRLREIPSNIVSTAAAFIAEKSFGIYLFHSAALILFLPRLGVWGAVPALAVTLLVSLALFIVIEDPLIRFGRNLVLRQDNHHARIGERPA